MGNLVKVIWDDAGAFSMEESWLKPNEIISNYQSASFACTSVGHFIHEDSDSVIICQNMEDEFCQYSGCFRIPKGMVKEIVKLEGGK